jgi:hypothetical protein
VAAASRHPLKPKRFAQDCESEVMSASATIPLRATTICSSHSSRRVGLEEVLAGIAIGRLPIFLADAVQFTARCADRDVDDDGGISEQYDGTLSVGGIVHGFACSVFTDRSGARCVSDIRRFEPIEWRARVAIPELVPRRA